MGKSIHARIAECEEKIAMYQARYDKADTEAKRTKAMKSINAWNERLEEATEMSLKSIEKSEKSSVRSTIPLGNELWTEDEKEVTFADEYTSILGDLEKSTPIKNDERRRLVLKNIRMLEMSCGLMHDMALDEAPIEDLEAHFTSIKQQCARQNKSLSTLAMNMYVGLLVNGSHIINHYSDDLGFHVDKDIMNATFHDSGTMSNLQEAIAEIFEDNPDVCQYFAVASRGFPRLMAVTAMATMPAVRIGTIEKKC